MGRPGGWGGRNAGCAILLISEDLDEILELADRIVVMRAGRIVHEAPAAGADPHAIGAHMLDAQAMPLDGDAASARHGAFHAA